MVTFAIKSHTWAHWLMNAYESEERARDARRTLITEIETEQPRESATTEMRWSMRAITESANAIEALGGDVLDAMGVEEVRKGPASERVLVNASHAAELVPGEWEADLDWLFKLRNTTVHAKPTSAHPEAHPLGIEFMGSVSVEGAVMTSESATRAVDIATRFIESALTNPRDDLAARKWAGQLQDLLQDLLSRRTVEGG